MEPVTIAGDLQVIIDMAEKRMKYRPIGTHTEEEEEWGKVLFLARRVFGVAANIRDVIGS